MKNIYKILMQFVAPGQLGIKWNCAKLLVFILVMYVSISDIQAQISPPTLNPGGTATTSSHFPSHDAWVINHDNSQSDSELILRTGEGGNGAAIQWRLLNPASSGHFYIGSKFTSPPNLDDLSNFTWHLKVDRYSGLVSTKNGISVGTDLTVNNNINVGLDGVLNFANKTRQMINLWSSEYGIGIQGGTQYFRTGKNFAWYKLGSHNGGELNAGGGQVQMVINDGKVGIGTNFINPQGQLHVKGIGAGGTIRISPTIADEEAAIGFLSDDNSGSGWVIGRGSWTNTEDFVIGKNFGSNPGAQLIVKGQDSTPGFVGIGTNMPTERLEVAGTVKALGLKTGLITANSGLIISGNTTLNGTTNLDGYVKVNNTLEAKKVWANPDLTFPDYVFEASYTLQPLSEVAEFIEKNHHLPEVPSAAQINEEGYDMAAMDAILLKKIEELTLHLITLQKENEALKQQEKK